MTKKEKATIAKFCQSFCELAARMRLRSTVRQTGEQMLNDAEDACGEVVGLFSKKEVEEYDPEAVDHRRVSRRM